MADFTPSELELQAHAALVHPGISVGAAVSVDAFLACKVYIQHASSEAIANATGVSYFVQVSSEAAGNRDWLTISRPITKIVLPNLANIAGAEAIGQTNLAVVAGEEAAFTQGNLIYIHDTTVEADSEWHRIDDKPTNAIHIFNGLAVAKDAADNILDQAEEFIVHLDLAGVRRMRLVVLHRAVTGSNIAFKAKLISATAIE